MFGACVTMIMSPSSSSIVWFSSTVRSAFLVARARSASVKELLKVLAGSEAAATWRAAASGRGFKLAAAAEVEGVSCWGSLAWSWLKELSKVTGSTVGSGACGKAGGCGAVSTSEQLGREWPLPIGNLAHCHTFTIMVVSHEPHRFQILGHIVSPIVPPLTLVLTPAGLGVAHGLFHTFQDGFGKNLLQWQQVWRLCQRGGLTNEHLDASLTCLVMPPSTTQVIKILNGPIVVLQSWHPREV
jgi:hypothetical protein